MKAYINNHKIRALILVLIVISIPITVISSYYNSNKAYVDASSIQGQNCGTIETTNLNYSQNYQQRECFSNAYSTCESATLIGQFTDPTTHKVSQDTFYKIVKMGNKCEIHISYVDDSGMGLKSINNVLCQNMVFNNTDKSLRLNFTYCSNVVSPTQNFGDQNI